MINVYLLVLLVPYEMSVRCEQTNANHQNELDGSIWLGHGPLSKSSAKLDELLRRTGPNMRASADYHDFTDIKLNESIEAWKSLHEQAKRFAISQIQFYKPKLQKLFNDANVSRQCSDSVHLTLDSMQRLDSWAIRSEYTSIFDSNLLF